MPAPSVDLRFYEALGARPVRDLAQGCVVVGDEDREISGIAPAAAAGPRDIAWLEGKGARDISPAVGAVFLAERDVSRMPADAVALLTKHPRASFAKAAAQLFGERPWRAGAAPIDPTAQIDETALLAPGCVVGPGAEVGPGARIGPNVSIGPGVRIGARTRIGANVSLSCAIVGEDVTILPGARIGQPGFAVAAGPSAPVEVPHFGRVIIADRALIGANVTIDRGLFDDTMIGEDAKIDNLCQIAHNVRVGRGAIVAALTGISGSTTLGEGAVLAGGVGLADHVQIGARATIAARSGVMHHVPEGETWAGYPAKPIRRWLREVAWLQHNALGKRDDVT